MRPLLLALLVMGLAGCEVTAKINSTPINSQIEYDAVAMVMHSTGTFEQTPSCIRSQGCMMIEVRAEDYDKFWTDRTDYLEGLK
jgi:hypothetical protein